MKQHDLDYRLIKFDAARITSIKSWNPIFVAERRHFMLQIEAQNLTKKSLKVS